MSVLCGCNYNECDYRYNFYIANIMVFVSLSVINNL